MARRGDRDTKSDGEMGGTKRFKIHDVDCGMEKAISKIRR
jgi:hypothetical protein